MFLFAFAAVSAPAATSFCTTAMLLSPDLALKHTLLMSMAEPVASILQDKHNDAGIGQHRRVPAQLQAWSLGWLLQRSCYANLQAAPMPSIHARQP